MKAILTSLIVFIVLTSIAFPADLGMHYSGSCRWTLAMDVWVEDDYAYCAFNNGLMIMDVSDPANMDTISTLYLRGGGLQLFKQGSFLYIADNDNGLKVVGVSDPANPVYVGGYDTPGLAMGVYVINDLAYIADAGEGLLILDVSIPAAPTYVGEIITIENAQDIFVVGDMAYVAVHRDGLELINVSNPSAPYHVSSYDLSAYSNSVEVVGDLAYVGDDWGGLFIINIATPSSPYLVGSYSVYANRVMVQDNYVYTLDDRHGLTVFDVTNPAAPDSLGNYNTDGFAYGLFVVDTIVYVADGIRGIKAISVYDPENMYIIDSYETFFATTDVFVKDDLAFIANGSLDIIDISDPLHPIPVGSHPAFGKADDVFVMDTLAYVAVTDTGMLILNIKDPYLPDSVGHYLSSTEWSWSSGIFVKDTLAYITNGNGFDIVNIKDPTMPTFVGIYDNSGWYAIGPITVMDTLAFVGYETSEYMLFLQIINVADPTAPVWLSSTSGHDVVVRDTLLYTVDWNLWIYNIADPVNPVLVNDFDCGYGNAIELQDNLAFVSLGDEGVQVIDITDPLSLSLVGSYDTPGRAYDIQVVDSIVYVADNWSFILLNGSEVINAPRVWHVATTGDDITGDGTTSFPFATIQHAIDIALENDTVMVAPGTYTGDGNRDIIVPDMSLTIMSSGGPDITTIDCQASEMDQHYAILFSTADTATVRFEGFTITNAFSYYYGAVHCDRYSYVTIRNCTVTQCSSKGIHTRFESWTAIENCTINYNGESGIWSAGHLSVNNCLVTHNDWAGLYLDWGDVSVTNCTFAFNGWAGNWAGISFYGEPPKDGTPLSTRESSVSNVITAFNAGAGVQKVFWFGEPSIFCTNSFGNIGGNWNIFPEPSPEDGNFSADPMFCDTILNDFHISDASPCAPGNNTCQVLIGALDPGCEGCCQNRGDVNHNGGAVPVDITDVTYMVEYLFLGGPPPVCYEEGDIDGSGLMDISDLTFLIEFLFHGGIPPAGC